MKICSNKVSPRELQVLQVVSDGNTYSKTAEILNICRKTVCNHILKIRSKYGNKKLIPVIKIAVLEGIIS